MPADLKDRLDAAALENKRSLTAEIVARLEGSFMKGDLNEGPIFSIVLDAKGYPLDWPQIAAHIHRTAKAAGLDSVGFKAAIFDVGARVDDPFAKEYMRLIRWYQKQTREHRDEIRGGAEATKDAVAPSARKNAPRRQIQLPDDE